MSTTLSSICAIFLAGAWQIQAAVFTIDSTQSQITLSGSVMKDYTFSPQAPGSLTATYQGNINAIVSDSTIQFTGSSSIAAMTNGSWQPQTGGASGIAPADYGYEIFTSFGEGYGAARNIVMDLTSPPLTLTGTNFDSTQLNIIFATDSNPVLDYESFEGSGSLALSGSAANFMATGSSISTNGNTMQLVIQIQTTLEEADQTVITLAGQIVATNLFVPVPPQIIGAAATGGNFVITATNTSSQPQLLISTNLTAWTPASFTIMTNGGFILFTTPISRPSAFFRVQ